MKKLSLYAMTNILKDRYKMDNLNIRCYTCAKNAIDDNG